MATGNKCHEGPCGACYLCGIHASRYTHPEGFSSELHQGTHTQRDSAVSYTPSCVSKRSKIYNVRCICYACYMHNIHNPTFTPHWKTKPSKTRSRCSIECCEATAVKCTHLASKEEVEHTLNQMVTALSGKCKAFLYLYARPITTSLLVCLCTYICPSVP